MDIAQTYTYIPDKSELRDFSRTIVEIHFLLICVVIFYLVVPGAVILHKHELILATAIYTVFVLIFHYLSLQKIYTPWKLAIESWVMILFITDVVLRAGTVDNPLANLYLLAIVISALTLGKSITLLQVGLISTCYLYLNYYLLSHQIFSGNFASHLTIKLFPVWLVAYLTTKLATDIQVAKNKIRLLSEVDELTGLLNMRAFKITFGRHLIQAKLYQREFSVLMVDSDNLKHINDQYGHAAGNKLICTIAQTITSSLRGSDIAARYGGDEFIALLADTGQQQALTVAERMRTKLANHPLTVADPPISCTVSIGIACFPAHGDDPHVLLTKADQAMYHSKTTGKNKTFIYAVNLQ